MSDGDSLARRSLRSVGALFRRLRRPLGGRRTGGYHIQPYRGHGNEKSLFLSGRVLVGRPLPPGDPEDSPIRNFWQTVRRLTSDEVRAARVSASVEDVSTTVTTDAQGFFEVSLPIATRPVAGEVWREVALHLIDPPSPNGQASTHGLSIVPPTRARFGIISDIDDTVVRTDVTNLVRMLRLVLLTNAHSRLPFAGVAALYRALHEGCDGPFTNPIFYVSSSPWNFYDLLTEIFEVHDIPVGPLFLKDYGLARDLILSRGHREHKLGAIERILAAHPHLSFVLIGDSGQKDPEIYLETVRRHPGRVTAIYIRDVSAPARDAEVHAIVERVGSLGVEMLLVPDTLAAAEHAASRGYIDPAALPEVRGDRAHDLGLD